MLIKSNIQLLIYVFRVYKGNPYILYSDAILLFISQLCKHSGPIFPYSKGTQMNLYDRFFSIDLTSFNLISYYMFLSIYF